MYLVSNWFRVGFNDEQVLGPVLVGKGNQTNSTQQALFVEGPV